MQARVRFAPVRRNPLRRSCVSDARNAGESAICPSRGQPSAEIVCDLSRSGATLFGDRACRMNEMQARVRFVPVAGNPLRRSCVSNARNARRMRETQARVRFVPVRSNPRRDRVRRMREMHARARPSAEIVRVGCAKRRRECDLPRSGATLCGDRACRLCSTTLARGAICGAGS